MGLKFGLTLKNGCGFKVSENKMINSVIVQNIIFVPIGGGGMLPNTFSAKNNFYFGN